MTRTLASLLWNPLCFAIVACRSACCVPFVTVCVKAKAKSWCYSKKCAHGQWHHTMSTNDFTLWLHHYTWHAPQIPVMHSAATGNQTIPFKDSKMLFFTVMWAKPQLSRRFQQHSPTVLIHVAVTFRRLCTYWPCQWDSLFGKPAECLPQMLTLLYFLLNTCKSYFAEYNMTGGHSLSMPKSMGFVTNT